jgi:copper transport protein
VTSLAPAPRRRRGPRAVAALLLLVLGLLFAATGPAQAHATLLGSDPAEGAVVATAPERITFTFNETIGAVPGGVHVFDAQGDPVTASASATGSKLEVALPEPVEDGTLIVVWRIVSDDGHPVSGSLRFSVGAPSATVADIKAPSSGAESPPVLLQALRIAGYASLLLTVGLVAFLLLVLPSGAVDSARTRLVSIARWAAGVAVVAWLAAVPVVATYQLGGGAGLLGKASTWSALAPIEYVVALLVALGSVAAVVLVADGAPARTNARLALAAAGVAVVAPALVGHTRATSPEWLMVLVDALHLVAGSVWLGGVVALAAVLPLLAERGTAAAEALSRFSVIAAGVLTAVGITGVLLAWRIVGSWSALVETAYGRLLIAKILTVLAVVGLAALNRFVLLPRVEQTTKRRERQASASSVGRIVVAEAALLVVVVVLTGLLVDRSPDVAAVAAGPAVGSTKLGAIEAKATVTSPAPGPSTVTLELLDRAGNPTEGYAAPSVRLSSAALDLGDVPLQNVGPGVYTGSVVFPNAGQWELEVSLRTGEFDNPVASVPFTVKESSR